MAGQHGHAMLRLPYPVKVDAVTLDHASSLLLEETSSAPRNVVIVGYPPCSTNECNGMGFDLEGGGFDLVTFEYQVDGTSAQTFLVSDQGSAAGECSETTTSCSAPPEMQLSQDSRQEANVVGGIMLKVLDNWGNEDFTCIYRLRVHGEAVQD